MAMTLNDYFNIRCRETFDALGNMRNLFTNLSDHVRDNQLKSVIQQQLQAIQQEMQIFSQITNSPMPEQMPEHVATTSEEESGEQLMMIGRTWTGTVGRSTVEHFRLYVTRVPEQVLDVNTAMLSEEVCHFNLGNYTGLIVLAKELGNMDNANRLQACIDSQTQLRVRIEDTLWQIIRTEHQREEQRKAA
ncbi:MAG TPA: hypothetical protein VHV83_13585 [Armatimonadota bacterium]|nr:hypothetical protein [Armatimonadota bacterium]